MSAAVTKSQDWREWTNRHLLVVSFSVSLLFHVLAWGFWKISPWVEATLRRFLPAKTEQVAEAKLKKTPEEMMKELLQVHLQQPPPPAKPPLTLMQTDPNTATEPPKSPEYYSVNNTQAANPDASRDTEKPKIDGKQSEIPAVLNVPKPIVAPPVTKPSPAPSEPEDLVPQPKQLAKADVPQEELKSKQAAPKQIAKGDLSKGRPQPEAGKNTVGKGKDDETEKPRERPKTLLEAAARMALNDPRAAAQATERMKQEGGVTRQNSMITVDAIQTPFAAYDTLLIAAIERQWHRLLEDIYRADRRGQVLVVFRLHADGRVTNVKATESTVEDILSYACESAITVPAPFEKWPKEMRQLMGGDYRDVRIRFHYR